MGEKRSWLDKIEEKYKYYFLIDIDNEKKIKYPLIHRDISATFVMFLDVLFYIALFASGFFCSMLFTLKEETEIFTKVLAIMSGCFALALLFKICLYIFKEREKRMTKIARQKYVLDKKNKRVNSLE